jgi:hypothetical protein
MTDVIDVLAASSGDCAGGLIVPKGAECGLTSDQRDPIGASTVLKPYHLGEQELEVQ